MDAAYDHIQEETLRPDEVTHTEAQSSSQSNLNTELQEAYKSFSASPWGARLGGFLGTVKKQSETYYKEAQKEAAAASEKGLKGFTGLTSQLTRNVRSMSLEGSEPAKGSVWDDGFSDGEEGSKLPAEEQTPKAAEKKVASSTENADLQESASLISRFRSEATKRLREIEKAEDAADEALLKFGSNVRNFLRDAVTISAPSETTPNSADSASSKAASKKSQVLFESKDSEGKRVIHTTRFDAQLHAVHSSQEGFTVDPKESAEWEKWKDGFDVEAKTDDIARDLEKYESLRRMMERLVPEKVEYAEFWRRYYFLRMVLDQEEGRRRELLKGATTADDETVAWDADSDSDSESKPAAPKDSSKPYLSPSKTPSTPKPTDPSSSQTTLHPSKAIADSAPVAAHPRRRSQDQHSQPDSDASYDLVSGATSQAPGSPVRETTKGEESEEEDWE